MKTSAMALLILGLLALGTSGMAEGPASAIYCPEGMTCLAQAPSVDELGFSKDETQADPEKQALLDKRSHMLKIHQRLGLITTVPMFAALLTGPGGHAPQSQVNLHAAIGSTAVVLYGATAYYAIFAPKVAGVESKGPTKVHKALAWVHGISMIATPILGGMALSQRAAGNKVTGIAQYHKDAAFVAVTSFAAAMLSVSIRW